MKEALLAEVIELAGCALQGGDFDDGCAVFFHPDAALGAVGTGGDFDRRAIHAQDGMVEAGDLRGIAFDVVTDKRAAETVGGGVGHAAVDERAVEEEDVTGFHNHGFDGCAVGQRDGDIGETPGGIGFDRAEQRPCVAAGDDLHTAVGFVAVIEGEPRGEAGAGLDAQVVVVLMEGLPTRTGGFEVEHGLDGEGFAPCEKREHAVDAGFEHPIEADLIPAVHVDHARVAFERVAAVEIDTAEVAVVGSGGA